MFRSKKLAVVLLIIFSLSAWLPNDECHGKNRHRFPFNTEEEKTSFNHIRTLESKVVRSQSHLKFFTQCRSQGLRPVNMEYNGHFNLAFSDYSINEKLKAVDEQNIDEKLMLCINHFKTCHAKLTEEVASAKDQLKKTVSSERYSFLVTHLDVFRESLTKQLEVKKEKKLRKLQWTCQDTMETVKVNNSVWISDLKIEDRNLILNGEELNDAHITVSMSVLSKQYPITVQPPSVFYASGYDYCPFETVQIAHNDAHHWVLLSSAKGVVSIYDSLQMKPTESLRKQINQLFSPDDARPKIVQMGCHKQVGSIDCGVFTVAYAVDVLEGNNPESIRYEQMKMRRHMIHCIEADKFTPFPRY